MNERQYDIVLYGASGFTGRQTVKYFATHAHLGQTRWAIAGRNREKLEAVKAQVGGSAESVDVLLADSRDQAAVDAIAGRTRVLLNTAGPFALYGDALVAACVRLQTHYVDITGETPWVKALIERHHDQAAADGTRIIPCCGFDSVPSDLGSYLVVRHMQRELGVPCKAVKAYFQVYGGFNGGTLASLFNLYDSGQVAQARDPFLLNPPAAHGKEEIEGSRDPVLPGYDADLGAWVGPFFMGPINTRVVRRSQALFSQWQNPYGPDFKYQEYLKFDSPLAGPKAIGVTAAMSLFQGALQLSPIRRLLQSLLPQPGSGPSERTLDRGWFRCELLGLTEDGRRVRGLISDQGDPGNRATTKFLCEAVLGLALNTSDLPGGHERGGILTPATGLGEVLASRLREAGVLIEVAAPPLAGR
jgi:short subunit dehydrogenase-like uncharacterized protein